MGARARLVTGPFALIAGAAILVVVALTGCAGSSSEPTTSLSSTTTSVTAATTTSSTKPETTTTTAAKLDWGQAGTWQGITVSAAAPQVDPAPESVDPGDEVVYCLVKIVNNSKESFDYNGLDFLLVDTDRQEYDSFALTSLPDLGEGSLAPGESVQGAVAFELPSAAMPSGLVWQPQSAPAPTLIWGQP